MREDEWTKVFSDQGQYVTSAMRHYPHFGLATRSTGSTFFCKGRYVKRGMTRLGPGVTHTSAHFQEWFIGSWITEQKLCILRQAQICRRGGMTVVFWIPVKVTLLQPHPTYTRLHKKKVYGNIVVIRAASNKLGGSATQLLTKHVAQCPCAAQCRCCVPARVGLFEECLPKMKPCGKTD